MKRLLLVGLLILGLTGCSHVEEQKPMETAETEVEHYITSGRYYTTGTVVTSDGNEWCYDTETISDLQVYNGMPVNVVMSDEGTELISDDVVLGLVYDMETAIYDELEVELSYIDGYEMVRNGNVIRITEEE